MWFDLYTNTECDGGSFVVTWLGTASALQRDIGTPHCDYYYNGLVLKCWYVHLLFVRELSMQCNTKLFSSMRITLFKFIINTFVSWTVVFRKSNLRKAHRYATAFSILPLLVYALMGLKSSFSSGEYTFNALNPDACGCSEFMLIAPKWFAIAGASMTILNIVTGLFLFSPRRYFRRITAS